MAARGKRAEARAAAEAALGHRLATPALLDDALAHAARIGGRGGPAAGRVTHERLEFLGDRVVGLLIAEALLQHFPGEAEGSLNLRLVGLVRAETLAEIAHEIGLDALLRARSGDAPADAAPTPTILADALEAVVAALYLDGGLDAARRFVMEHWRSRLADSPPPRRDAKTALQEWAQARALPLPRYRLIAATGPDHAPEFAVEVSLPGIGEAAGRGTSKRSAEQQAAAALLQRLTGEPTGA
jgi:ribonuclease-3